MRIGIKAQKGMEDNLKIGKLETQNNIFLAPMAGVTDSSFRRMCIRYGCGLVISEMISAKALHYKDKKTAKMLNFSSDEQPFGIQLFGSEPDIIAEAVKIVSDTGASIIDINMGCPAPKIANHGEGSALMNDIKNAASIITMAVHASNIPITIKCRKGWDDGHINVVEFAKMAQECGASAITVHGRTREQFYSGKADWDIIGEVKQNVSIPVIGNGDIFDAQDALDMQTHTGCDGVMIGRGAQGNPFIFRQVFELYTSGNVIFYPTLEEKINVLLEQIRWMMTEKGEHIAICEARKHAAWYLKCERNSAHVRGAVNTANSYDDIKNILTSLL